MRRDWSRGPCDCKRETTRACPEGADNSARSGPRSHELDLARGPPREDAVVLADEQASVLVDARRDAFVARVVADAVPAKDVHRVEARAQ